MPGWLCCLPSPPFSCAVSPPPTSRGRYRRRGTQRLADAVHPQEQVLPGTGPRARIARQSSASAPSPGCEGRTGLSGEDVCAGSWSDTARGRVAQRGLHSPAALPALPLPGTLQLETRNGSGEIPFCHSLKQDQQSSRSGRFGPGHSTGNLHGVSMGSREEKPGVRRRETQQALTPGSRRT